MGISINNYNFIKESILGLKILATQRRWGYFHKWLHGKDGRWMTKATYWGVISQPKKFKFCFVISMNKSFEHKTLNNLSLQPATHPSVTNIIVDRQLTLLLTSKHWNAKSVTRCLAALLIFSFSCTYSVCKIPLLENLTNCCCCC